MSKIKKMIIGSIIGGMMVVSSMPVFAGSMKATSAGQNFTDDWELSAGSGNNAIMKYGFNTAWIDEDYTHTYSSTNSHTAYVRTTKGEFTANAKAKKWAKIEVTHRTDNVTYRMEW